MATSFMPPNLVSNLQEALMRRKDSNNNDENDGGGGGKDNDEPTSSSSSSSFKNDPEKESVGNDEDSSKPRILITNGDGIESYGLTCLVEGLVKEGLYNVYVCAPQLDKSVSGHSVTFGESVAVSSIEMSGAIAYEVSGTPVDCVSLALSGALFSWSRPLLVVSGINKGSNCGQQMVYSGVVAAAKEALISGVPSISISLNWKKDESQESDFKDAVALSLQIINSAARDIQNGVFPQSCGLNIHIPTSPSTNKGFKVTKQSLWRSTPCWQAISAKRYPSNGYMPNQPGFGIQLAQLGRDASAAGAARRLTAQKQNLEIESVGAAGKPKSNLGMRKHFRLEFLDKALDEIDEDFDIKALEGGFVTVVPFCVSPYTEPDIQTATSDWVTSALTLHGKQ